MFKPAIRRPLMCLALILVLALGGAGQVFAATGGNGLRVSPVRTDIIVSPGETKILTVNITNVTSSPAILQAIINDFVGNVDESGNPSILLDPTQAAPKHSFKSFVSKIPNVSLNPGEQKGVPVTIKVPKDTPGGGYFGVVRFAPASTATDKKETVSLAGSVGSLVLLKVPGDIKEQLNITSFDVRHKDSPSGFFTSNKDIDAVTRFQNLGNIQEAPFGKVLLKNRSGKILESIEINNTNPPGNVLPDSIRKFPVPLTKVGKFGQFKLEGNFGYGAGGQLLSASTTFYVIPTMYIIAFAVIVALLVFMVFGLPRLIKAYNRRVIRNARRSSR